MTYFSYLLQKDERPEPKLALFVVLEYCYLRPCCFNLPRSVNLCFLFKLHIRRMHSSLSRGFSLVRILFMIKGCRRNIIAFNELNASAIYIFTLWNFCFIIKSYFFNGRGRVLLKRLACVTYFRS